MASICLTLFISYWILNLRSDKHIWECDFSPVQSKDKRLVTQHCLMKLKDVKSHSAWSEINKITVI